MEPESMTRVIGWSQRIWCWSQILRQELWGGASGYGVRASGYGSLVIIVSAQSKELGFWVF